MDDSRELLNHRKEIHTVAILFWANKNMVSGEFHGIFLYQIPQFYLLWGKMVLWFSSHTTTTTTTKELVPPNNAKMNDRS